MFVEVEMMNKQTQFPPPAHHQHLTTVHSQRLDQNYATDDSQTVETRIFEVIFIFLTENCQEESREKTNFVGEELF